METRLSPFLRCYAIQRPTEDHGGLPALLVVFEGDLAAARFDRFVKHVKLDIGAVVPCRSLVAARPLGAQ